MKSLLRTFVAAAVLSLSLGVFASEKPLGFPSLQALRDWAKGGQDHLGGWVQVLSSGTNRIAVVRRVFTRRTASCDFWAFIARGERWEEALRLGPYWNRMVEYKQHDDRVAVTVVSFGSEAQEVVNFSIAGLCLQYPEGLKGAEPGGAANRSQPTSSETNSASPAAGSGR